MYSVTKRIDFCYGHRLLDYDGICKHPHGHNAVAEIEVRTGPARQPQHGLRLQRHQADRQGWIDRELDHKMILRRDDPLVKPLQALGEPMYLLESNPTVERIARFDLRLRRRAGLPVVRVRLWGRPRPSDSRTRKCGTRTHVKLVVFDLDGTLVDSRGAISPMPPTRCSWNRSRAACPGTRDPGAWWATAPAVLVARAFEAAGPTNRPCESRPLSRHLRQKPFAHTR